MSSTSTISDIASSVIATITNSPTLSSTESSASPTTTNNNNNNNNNNRQDNSPGTFYRNLFYILIGLLCAFGLVSFFSLLRARHRRNAIVREANRLGVMVPGLPGYIPMRERQSMAWIRPDGGDRPEFWDVEQKTGSTDERKQKALSLVSDDAQLWPLEKVGSRIGKEGKEVYVLEDGEELSPIAVIPAHQPKHKDPPIPLSPMPFFPNHLAYRAASLLPPPARFDTTKPSSYEQLAEEHIEVVTIIRMPHPENNNEIEEGEEVIREWGGVEVGIARMGVGSNPLR